MTPADRPALLVRLEGIKEFVRAWTPGGCRLLSDPNCQCRLCTIDKVLALLSLDPAPAVARQSGEIAQALTPHQAQCLTLFQEPCNCDQPVRMKRAESLIARALTDALRAGEIAGRKVGLEEAVNVASAYWHCDPAWNSERIAEALRQRAAAEEGVDAKAR